MNVNTEGHGHRQELFQDLYTKLNETVWVIKIEGSQDDTVYEAIYTGFTVSRDGHVLSCSHGDWHSWSNKTFKARRLTGTSGFEFDLEFVSLKKRWDMCLFKINLPNHLKESECAKFASGKLDFGENIFLIGHPKEFVGSCIVGRVAYACLDTVESNYDRGETCYNFTSEALAYTPLHRIMGHIFDSRYFRQLQDRKIKVKCDFEKNLQARLPIIQCFGFIGGEGTSGAPIFNINGEVVGMFILQSDGYQIGVHVTAIKEFVKHAMASEEVVNDDTRNFSLEGGSKSSQLVAKKRKA